VCVYINLLYKFTYIYINNKLKLLYFFICCMYIFRYSILFKT